MKFSNMIKKITLGLLLSVSITNLPADTNTSADTEPISTTASPTSPTPDSTSVNPLLIQVKTFAENLELVIGMIFNIKSGQGKRLVDTVTPILSYCDSIKKLPDDASTAQILQAYTILKDCTQNLLQLLEKGSDQVSDTISVTPINDSATDADLAQAHVQVDTNFIQLVSKVEEAYQDVWRNLRMHVNNQLNKIDKILQDVNINVSNNDSIVGKDEIKKEIMGLRTQLRQIQKELSLASTNPQAVLSVYQVNKAFIAYLQDCQKYKFRKWAVVDLVDKIRSMPDLDANQTLDELLFEMMRTNIVLDKLEKDAEKIDLTIVNQVTRMVGDYVVDPIQRHNLLLWAAAALATAGIATYTAYYFDETFFTDPNCWFRRIFGFRNHQRGKMTQIPPEKYFDDLNDLLSDLLTPEEFAERLNKKKVIVPSNAKEYSDAMDKARRWQLAANQAKRATGRPLIPIDSVEEFIYENKSGTAAVGLSLIGLATYSYYAIWKKYHDTWSKKIFVWFSKLKGGSYSKTAEKYDLILPTITFDDVIGLEHEKSLVYPHLKYIKDPESWDANGRTPPTGILLIGDTRTGKTFFAKAICGELHKQNPEKGIKFLSIDAHDIKAEGIATWIGVAKMLAPCILFIDEIDLLNLQRTGDRTLLSDFLKAMSGIEDKDPKKQVIVIGTTNKPENIDHAMIQSGRLALVIPFSYPNLKDRIKFIEKRFEKFAIDPKAFDIDIKQLAYETNGKSFEDIKLMLDTAFIRTDLKGEAISQEHLEWALDKLRQIIDLDTKEVTNDEKRAIAAHFAGEVLSHYILNLQEKIAKVTIRQIVVKTKEEAASDSYKADHKKQAKVEQGAVFTYLEHDTYDIKTADELEKKAKTYIGARVAERIITNTASTELGFKKNDAFNLIKTIISDGIDLKALSKEGQNKISDETLVKLKEFEKEMEQLLMQHKDTLVALTNKLQEKQSLTFSEIKKIIDTVEGTGAIGPDSLPEQVASVAA